MDLNNQKMKNHPPSPCPRWSIRVSPSMIGNTKCSSIHRTHWALKSQPLSIKYQQFENLIFTILTNATSTRKEPMLSCSVHPIN